EIRNKFTRSTAAYCMISFLLGFGDRHLDNIMVTESGLLFHIDYSYIFNDPKYMDTSIRLTQDMIDAIGGINSKNYIVFQDHCIKIYNCLRNNIKLIANMLMLFCELFP